MIKRYMIVNSFILNKYNEQVHNGYDVIEMVFSKGEQIRERIVKHTSTISIAIQLRNDAESDAKTAKQWLELLPPVAQFDSLTEEEMLKDYV